MPPAPRVALPPRTGSGPRARVTNPPAMRDGSTAPTAAGESSSAVLKQPGGLGTKGRLSSREALLNRPKGKPPAKPAEKAASEEEKNGEAKAEPETEKKSDE